MPPRLAPRRQSVVPSGSVKLPQAFEVDSGSDLVPGFEIAEVSNATLPIRSVFYFAIFRPLGA